MNGALLHIEQTLAYLYLIDARADAMRYLLRKGESGDRVVLAISYWCRDWWRSAYVSAGLLRSTEQRP